MEILLALAHCPPKVTSERSYAEEALALARETGDEASEANALMSLAIYNADPGQQAAAGSGPIELIAQARDMAARRGADEALLLAAVNESHLLEGAGEHELAAAAAGRPPVSAGAPPPSPPPGRALPLQPAEPPFRLRRRVPPLAGGR